MMAIDWTKPLELLDDTPVRLTRDDETGEVCRYSNPDPDGDYWIEREDGERIESIAKGRDARGYLQMCVHANGCEEGTGTVIVRNRDGHVLPDPATIIRDLLEHSDGHRDGHLEEWRAAIGAAQAYLEWRN